jgi:C4-dicarboxylate-specific signal transduction histidine kinase
MAFLAVEAALQGHGPFSGRSPDETALVLQNFLLLRSAPLLLVAVLIDQSKVDQKQAAESHRRLEHSQRLATVGQLTAAIAHELRQPLSAIMNNANAAAILLDSANPPMQELRAIISDIRADERRAREVIGRIRDFTVKRERGMEPLDLNSIIGIPFISLVEMREVRAFRVRMELTPERIRVRRRTQMEQVLINLAINGMDAMANTPRSRAVTVQTRPHGGDQVE